MPCPDVPQPQAAPSPATQAQATPSLAALLGGRRGALDATAPAVAFVAAWLIAGRSLVWGAAGALVCGGVAVGLRLRRGDRPLAALLGLLGVSVAVLIALHTGRAADFFLAQLVSNVASALVWMISILVRWPLLGVIVGGLLGQRGSWRHDPALLRAYALASWVWVGQYLVRVTVFTPLWVAEAVVALGIARLALSWPLVTACVAVSGAVLMRALPANHPGLRSVQRSRSGS